MNEDPMWKYVGQISGVLAITGAVVLILTTIGLAAWQHLSHHHLSSAEVTWASFLTGVLAAGLLSIAYGFILSRNKLGTFRDENKLATIAFWSGLVIAAVAVSGYFVPPTN